VIGCVGYWLQERQPQRHGDTEKAPSIFLEGPLCDLVPRWWVTPGLVIPKPPLVTVATMRLRVTWVVAIPGGAGQIFC